MEIIIAIAIIGVGLIWYFNAQKQKPEANKDALAPYKIEPPKATVNAADLATAEIGPAPVVEAAPAPVVEAAPVVEVKPAKKPRAVKVGEKTAKTAKAADKAATAKKAPAKKKAPTKKKTA